MVLIHHSIHSQVESTGRLVGTPVTTRSAVEAVPSPPMPTAHRNQNETTSHHRLHFGCRSCYFTPVVAAQGSLTARRSAASPACPTTQAATSAPCTHSGPAPPAVGTRSSPSVTPNSSISASPQPSPTTRSRVSPRGCHRRCLLSGRIAPAQVDDLAPHLETQ